MTALQGGCRCGHIRYVVEGTPFHMTLCHCRDCRTVTGAPVVAWFSLRPDELRWLAGPPKSFTSSPGIIRSFCPECGTPLTYRDQALVEIDITTCSLDDPEQRWSWHTIWRLARRWCRCAGCRRQTEQPARTGRATSAWCARPTAASIARRCRCPWRLGQTVRPGARQRANSSPRRHGSGPHGRCAMRRSGSQRATCRSIRRAPSISVLGARLPPLCHRLATFCRQSRSRARRQHQHPSPRAALRRC